MSTRIITADVLDGLAMLPDESVHCCVTSPPYYGLRDYGIDGQLGLEETPAEYVAAMVGVFREVRRVLRHDGTLWLNIGDSYAGSGKGGNPDHGKQSTNRGSQSIGVLYGKVGETARHAAVTNVTRKTFDGIKAKDLLGIPWMLAFALRDDGWWLRSEIIWAKRAPMPESVADRPTCAHEKVFLLSKSAKYFYDAEAVKEDAESDHCSCNGYARDERLTYADANGARGNHAGWTSVGGKRNLRNFWLLGPEPFPEAHFATFVTEVPRRAILVGTSERGACPKCGAPWARIVDKEGDTPRDKANSRGWAQKANGKGLPAQGLDYSGGHGSNIRDAITIGWRASCDHPTATPIQATILDCFLGSGTTALVADQLGRDCIGIDISPAYVAMAERRIRDDAGLFAQVAAQ